MAVYYPKFLVLFSFICLYVLDKYMSFVVTNVYSFQICAKGTSEYVGTLRLCDVIIINM